MVRLSPSSVTTFTSWEALAWLDGTGASFLHLDLCGCVVALSGQSGPDFPALRRAQVSALDTEVGLSIVKSLLGSKLDGQRLVIERLEKLGASRLPDVGWEPGEQTTRRFLSVQQPSQGYVSSRR